MADCFDVQSALQDAKCRVSTGLSRRVRPARRDAAVFESGVRVGGTYVREDLNDITDVSFDAVSVRVNTSILPVTVKRVSYESYADRLDVLDQHNTLILSADRPRRALDRAADGGILTDTGDW